jgi:hypothetical protein
VETDVEPEELIKVARETATVLEKPLEIRLATIYGLSWLAAVNGRLMREDRRSIRSLSDPRSCLSVFVYDPAVDGWASDRLRGMARQLLRLANRAHHNEFLTDGDLRLAQSIYEEFRQSFSPAQGKDSSGEIVLTKEAAKNGGISKIHDIDMDSGSSRIIKFRRPSNLGNNAKLRIPGKGFSGKNGGEPGDLILTIRIEPPDNLHGYDFEEDLEEDLRVPA